MWFLIYIIVILIIIGFLLWLVNYFIPMAAPIKALLNLIVTVAIIIWLLQSFGILGPIYNIKLG